ncbi:MAG: tetratricopeptide repeat protein [Promethearchaeota archaeon]
MTENHYNEVRMLLRKNQIEEAENINTELARSVESFSNEDKYWFALLSSEINRYKSNNQAAKKDIEEAFHLSKEIELTNAQMSSLHGRMATIQYRLRNYSLAIQSYQKALLFLSNDLGRQNYYRKMLLICYIKTKDEENFSITLKEGLNKILQGQLQEYWNSNLDFVWDISWHARQDPWLALVYNVLDSIVQPSDKIARGFLAYLHARLARNQLNQKEFLSYFHKSMKHCVTASPKILIPLSLNFVGMLQLFGEYQRAKNILEKCLQQLPEPSNQRILILNSLGSNLRFSGEYNLAIQYLNESLKINRKYVFDLWQEAYTHNTLGMIYTLIGNKEKATEHYKSSMTLSKENNDYYGLGYTYGALGWLEANQGNLEQAEKWYKSSVTIFEEKARIVPSIIMLAYAELLSRRESSNEKKIQELITRARNQIWKQGKRLDMGRYYNTLGNIALNQKQLEKAQKEFSLALEYGESFEVEAQTLLGITKTNLEFFLVSTEETYLEKARLFLTDLKMAAESSALIQGEVELILAIIEMHSQRYGNAEQKFILVQKHAHAHDYALLEEKVQKQKETLQILKTHDQLQRVTLKMNNHELKRSSIREAIVYLTELTKLLGTQAKKENEP